jgi:protein TonB
MPIGLLAAAVAAATAAAPVVITRPHWLARPTGYDVAAVYPLDAQRSSMSGSAEVVCRVAPSGGLNRCRVFAEVPVGAFQTVRRRIS